MTKNPTTYHLRPTPFIMPDKREQFLKRLSTVGMGARESVQVLLAGIVFDIREDMQRKRFPDDALDAVIAFHDRAESLWRESLATNPPMDPHRLTQSLEGLRDACTGPLVQFERKLARGVEAMERLEHEHESE